MSAWAPPQGGGGGARRERVAPNQKVGETSCLISTPPPNHDGSAVTVVIPAVKRSLDFNAYLFLAGLVPHLLEFQISDKFV